MWQIPGNGAGLKRLKIGSETSLTGFKTDKKQN